MVASLHVYIDYVELSRANMRKVLLPTGETSMITHLGSSSILNGLLIKNVLYVPQFRYNLLAVSKLTKDVGFFISFYPDCCVFQDIFNGNVKVISRVEHRLYVLD